MFWKQLVYYIYIAETRELGREFQTATTRFKKKSFCGYLVWWDGSLGVDGDLWRTGWVTGWITWRHCLTGHYMRWQRWQTTLSYVVAWPAFIECRQKEAWPPIWGSQCRPWIQHGLLVCAAGLVACQVSGMWRVANQTFGKSNQDWTFMAFGKPYTPGLKICEGKLNLLELLIVAYALKEIASRWTMRALTIQDIISRNTIPT